MIGQFLTAGIVSSRSRCHPIITTFFQCSAVTAVPAMLDVQFTGICAERVQKAQLLASGIRVVGRLEAEIFSEVHSSDFGILQNGIWLAGCNNMPFAHNISTLAYV